MNFRSAFPAAVVTGAVLGVGIAGLNLPMPSAIAALPPVAAVEISDVVRWDLPVVRNESVQRFVDLLGNSQADRMALYLKRSGRYEGMIRSKLRERGMPEDLVYLSMVESGFNPDALSVAHAVGLWQFVEGTARGYGLRVDEYIDERRDPERSTDAALAYLQNLHDRFGSWTLAAAAYNTGENRVARIMEEETGAERGTEGDFWRIRSRLPSETREYIPLIFAAALIGKEPHRYGLERVERLLPAALEPMSVPGGTSLDAVARSIGISTGDLRALNPHLVRGVTPPGGSYSINVPEGTGSMMAPALALAKVNSAAARNAGAVRLARVPIEASPTR